MGRYQALEVFLSLSLIQSLVAMAPLHRIASDFRPTPVEARSAPRECGDCTLCCTLQGVEDMTPPKPACVSCKHLNTGRQLRRHGGCSIHNRRPTSCQTYSCLWLGGLGEEEDRPDRLGAIFELVDADSEGEVVPAIVVRTVSEGEIPPMVQGLVDFCRSQDLRVGVVRPSEARKAGLGKIRIELEGGSDDLAAGK